MIRTWIATIAFMLAALGCAADGTALWERSSGSTSGGAPDSGPCQASG
jgi:hypothetical protein